MSYASPATIGLTDKAMPRESAWISLGKHLLSIRIADITLALESGDPRLAVESAKSAEKFLVDGVGPDVHVRASWGDLSEDKPGELVFDSGGSWRLYNVDGMYRFCFFSSVLGLTPYKEACFNPAFSQGTVTLHRPFFGAGRGVYPLEYPLDELVIVHLLARGRGAEVHACGVVDESGRGHLFVGQSGGGKTTMARLWEKQKGIKILSDDRIVLREIDNKIWMYGTPWHGEAGLADASRAPLTRVYFLRHGEKNRLVPQTPTAAVSRLLACGFPPFYSPEALDFTLGFLERVTRTVPCDEIEFVPDTSVVEFVLSESTTGRQHSAISFK